MNRILAVIGLLASITLVSACAGTLTSDHPARQYYLLEPLSLPAPRSTSESMPALALTVKAVPGLDTDHIQAINADSRLNQYANARWADFLPEVLGSVLRRSLVSSGQFDSVKINTAPDKGDWVLELEIQKFYGVQNSSGSTSTIIAEIEGLLLCEDQSHHMQLFSSTPVHEERLSVVVKAHQKALDDITRQLLDAVAENCQ